MLPGAPHPRQVVLELCQLDLELPLGADGVLREDVQDQLCPVDDAGLQRILEEALLRRLELVVHDQRLSADLLVGLLQLLDLPLPDVRSGRRVPSALHDGPDGLHARRTGQLVHLGQL